MGSTEKAQESVVLVDRILKGDRQAEKQMIELYQNGLYCILRSKVNLDDQDLLADIIQETWRVVIEKVRANDLKNPHKLAAFIITTGQFQLIMHYRKKQGNNFVCDDAMELMADEGVDPQTQLEQCKTKALVCRLINKLKKPRDREVLQSYYLNEESKESICKTHDLDELHFNRVVHRARNRFKKLWQRESDDE